MTNQCTRGRETLQHEAEKLVLWAVWIVLAWFGRDAFKPEFLSWINGFVRDLIILVALWISSRHLGGGN